MAQATKKIDAAANIKLEPYQVVLHPLVTEKGTHVSERHNAYTFSVNPIATKDQIKHAVEDLWSVRVLKVRTQNRKGKTRRHRLKAGKTASWKKAIVELHPEDRIVFF
jgi:large subunit ribosomal protein L23